MTYHRSDGNLEAEGYGEYFSLFDWIKERNPVSKTLKIILIVAAVLLVVGCGIMLFRFLRENNQIMDGPGMIREDTFDFSQKSTNFKETSLLFSQIISNIPIGDL